MADCTEISLGEFVKRLAALLAKRDVDLPLKNEKAWHLLFYELKRSSPGNGKPKFLDSLIFDWDASYPKCQDLSYFLHGLHRTASGRADNPTFGRLSVAPALVDIWSTEAEKDESDLKKFVQSAVTIADREFAAEKAR